MVKAKQQDRIASFTCDLGSDVLLLKRMTTTDQLSRGFSFELDLLSENQNIAFEDILGTNAVVEINSQYAGVRYFNGFLTRFSYVGNENKFALYRATLSPWTWFLSRSANCRIFQNRTTPQIIDEVFSEFGFSDRDSRLFYNYEPSEYCVQYRETALDFVNRLLEKEGIYYYFTHDRDKHTLVLCDSCSSHEPVPGYEQVPYYSEGNEQARERDHLSQWSVCREIQSDTVALNDYNFKAPRSSLGVRSSVEGHQANSNYEIFDHPGDYSKKSLGEQYAKVRIEELQTQHEQCHASGTASQICTGSLFTLTDYPREDQNREYLVSSAEYLVVNNQYVSGDEEGVTCTCKISTLESRSQFRPARVTPKPLVQGPQTAIVVGNDEIHTDQYGRIKVQFHWDRYGNSDESSSCWIRVSQNWAGQDWGWQTVPHVGHEVVVEHLEGDPDRPIATGRVYNESNMPPAALPDNKTQSIWRDHGGNEIVMEGKKGKQTITLFSPTHSTKMVLGNSWTLYSESHFNMKSLKNWSTAIVGDVNVDVGGDLTSVFAGWKHKTTLGWVSEIIVGFKTTIIGGAKTEMIRGFETKNVSGVKTEVIQGRTFKHDKSKKYELTGDEKKIKAPNLWQQLKIANYMAEEYKFTCKKDKYAKVMGKAIEEAKEFNSKIEGASKFSAARFKWNAKQSNMEADKMLNKAFDYVLKADDAKIKARKVSYNNNALVIK